MISALIFVHLCIGVFLYTIFCNKTTTLKFRNPRHINPPVTCNVVNIFTIPFWPIHILVTVILGLTVFNLNIQTK